ncbi:MULTISPECIES: hypothetical protein [Thalassospira]|uniref:hypothetical protein n=1 Tax=Thalassospira TaxID=168934 RepID=UPI00257C819F|nr:hypothetical protein [Thalassospira sp. UBA4513]BDW87925.1 hypothetical protein MACH01_06920 [Thalassospira tepidiphila]|tara:strand:+ start:1222 stop:1692 length:471 start_codon:yes stop_codon:yes gene_type:complete
MKIMTRTKTTLLAVLMLLGAGIVATNPAFAYFSASDFSTIDCSGLIDPDDVRFSQDSISANFSDQKPVKDLIDGLKDGSVKPSDVPAIRIVKVDPKQVVKSGGNEVAAGVYTIDNRRLYAFQQAGKNIPCTKLDSIPENQKFKFTTDNDGTSIRVR